MVLGTTQETHEDRLGLDDLYNQVGTGEWDVELFGEVRKQKSYVYSGALYGGYDVSSRSRTEYVSIGDAYNVANGVAIIQSSKNSKLIFKRIQIPYVNNILQDVTLDNNEYNKIGIKIIKSLMNKIYDSKV